MVNALSLGHTRSVIKEVISGPEWTYKCYAFLKKTARDKKRAEEFKNAKKRAAKPLKREHPLPPPPSSSTAMAIFGSY